MYHKISVFVFYVQDFRSEVQDSLLDKIAKTTLSELRRLYLNTLKIIEQIQLINQFLPPVTCLLLRTVLTTYEHIDIAEKKTKRLYQLIIALSHCHRIPRRDPEPL